MEEIKEEIKLQQETEPAAVTTELIKEPDPKERRKQFRKGMLAGVLLSLFVLLLIIGGIIAYLFLSGTIRVSDGSKSTSTKSSTPLISAGGDMSFLPSATRAKMQILYETLGKNYYEDIDEDTMADSLYHAIAEGTGDPYTQYFSVEEMEDFTNYTGNSYYGIGVLFSLNEDGYALISKVYDDSPAQEAGIQAGDLIVAVFGESVAGKESSEISSEIKGAEGTYVTITIERDGERMDLDVERRDVTVDTVGCEVINEVAYIEVTKFSDNTANEFETALAKAKEENAKAIIVDLRDNGGGLVDVVIDMMDQVFGEGVTLTMEYTNGEDKVYTSDEEHKIDVPMVVLVNGESASASEIFTAAARDFETGTIVGTTTYGKGVHQQVISLTDGSALKVTTGKFYSPKGENFNGVGITPDIEVEYEVLEDADLVYGYEWDTQLTAAFNEAYRLAGITLPEAATTESTAESTTSGSTSTEK